MKGGISKASKELNGRSKVAMERKRRSSSKKEEISAYSVWRDLQFPKEGDEGQNYPQ